MNIKKHYKIIISVIIVIILISSFIVYDMYFKNNINYNNEGKSINVKYFGADYRSQYNEQHIKQSYSISSNYISNNKMSYLNSTLTKLRDLTVSYGSLYFGLNIHLKNTNSKYLYITIKSLNAGFPCPPVAGQLNNASIIKTTCSSNLYKLQLRATNNNISLPCICIGHTNSISNYNLSVEISLNNNFHNTFYINTMRETAIYGSVINSNLSTDRINSSFIIENMNNHNYQIINIVNGYYYCFLKPYTEYKLYSIDNNTLNLIYTINSSNLTAGNSFHLRLSSSSV